MLRIKLERLDGQRIYDADFEIAKTFYKHFMTKNATDKQGVASRDPIEIGESFVMPQSQNIHIGRPSTAPGPRPVGGLGMGVHQQKKLPGRMNMLRELDEDSEEGMSHGRRLNNIQEDDEKAEELKIEINDLKADNEDLREEINELNDRIKDMEKEAKTMDLQNKGLSAENKTLNVIMELKKTMQPGQDSEDIQSAE